MNATLESLHNREPQPVEAPKESPPEGPVAAAEGHGIKSVVQDVVQSRPLQIGLGVAAAAGAGLLLVSLVGAGAAAVAGAAGYLAYREMNSSKE